MKYALAGLIGLTVLTAVGRRMKACRLKRRPLILKIPHLTLIIKTI